MAKIEEKPYSIEKEFLGKITAEEMLARIIRAHVEMYERQQGEMCGKSCGEIHSEMCDGQEGNHGTDNIKEKEKR